MFLSIISRAKRGGPNAPFALFAATSATTARPARAARRSSSTFTKYKDIFDTFGIERKGNLGVYNGKWCGSGEIVKSVNPVTNEVIAEVVTVSVRTCGYLCRPWSGTRSLKTRCANALSEDRSGRLHFVLFLDSLSNGYPRNPSLQVPAPKRGDIVRQMREKLHQQRHALGALVSLEVGKIKAEGLGEVQEFIDIADYAVGLSRMLNGQVIPSERPGHFMMEQFHPLGVVGVISAFNFPSAVHGWNVALALVTGNATVWKPHQSTPLISIAQTKVLGEVLEANGLPGALCSLACGGSQIGQHLVDSHDVNLISFTGSTNTGGKVGVSVQKRFGKLILELGGNNAM
ncbi:MAG: Aldehyde/histidinol dehydrogenase, partial [Olpidium bornovanus]